MTHRLIYLNGEFVPEDRAQISIYDSALMFGDMVFEMTRSFNGDQFKLEEHIDRLMNGIKILRIPLTKTSQEIIDLCEQTVAKNVDAFAADDEHRLMIDVTRGVLDIYGRIDGLHQGPNLIISDFPLRWTVRGMSRFFEDGINAVIPSQRSIPARLLDPKIKSRSRLHYMMANIEVSQAEGARYWPLLLDPDGFITEGTGNNFFVVKDGIVLTPEGRNILRGISRAYVIDELAPQLGLEVVVTNLEPYDVYTADEAFMTGTPFCMLPVTSLNGVALGEGGVGPMFRELLSKWSGNVGVDISAQILRWDQGEPKSSMGKGTSPYEFGPGT